MIKFCSKCETAHETGRPCPPRALKAAGEKPEAIKPPPAPTVAALIESGEVRKGIPMNELITLEPPAPEISREVLGRGVAASAPDPVTVGSTKRDDEATARQPIHASVQSSQPPQFVDRPDCAKCEAKRLKNVEAVKKFRAKSGLGAR